MASEIRHERATELDPIYCLVGKRIREERDRLPATQDALALAVGMTRTSISNIEAGRQRVQLDTLAHIARAMGVSIVDLLQERVEPMPLFES